jgi:hypothetical protein
MHIKIKIISIVIIIFLILIFFFSRYTADVSALEKIKIFVESITIEEVRLNYCKLKVNVNVLNPTSEYISDFTAQFDIFIANTYVGNGFIPKVSIPIQSGKIKNVSITIFYVNVGNAVIDGIRTRNFDLSIKGTATVQILFNLISISKQFSASHSYI